MPSLQIPEFHAGQLAAYEASGRFTVIRCGRRWGKTEYGKIIAESGSAHGDSVGWFAPDYKIMSEAYNQILDDLTPIKKNASKNDGVIHTITGGRIDFWSLENERAGRSRKYHHAIIDEAAFAKDSMEDIWNKAIKPTLLDYRGKCTVLSTPNGIEPSNWFWKICNLKELGFVEYHAPTHTNPYLPKEELLKLEHENHPLVYRQEYLAEFVDFRGEAFFSLDKMLVNDEPVETPQNVHSVFAVLDTAVKEGKEHDGTAVIYCAFSPYHGFPLVILDWDIIQIEGALLETWLPGVYDNLNLWAKDCNSLNGHSGCHIEDKGSGMVLLQQAKRRGWPAHPISTKLTSLGKDERAINISGYIHRGMVKFSKYAHDKAIRYKGAEMNHMLNQIVSFRPGDKDARKRSDDALDVFLYAVSLALGDEDGY